METTQATVDLLNSELDNKGYSLGEDLKKITLDDLISEYGARENGVKVLRVTITGMVSLISKHESNAGAQYCGFTFAEDSAKFSTCAGDMPKLFNKLMNMNDNNIETLNELLKTTPMKVAIWKTKTKNGYRYAKVKVIGFAIAAPANPSRAEECELEDQMLKLPHDPFKDNFDLF